MDLLSSAQFLLSFCSVLLSRGVAHGNTLSGNFFLSRCFCAANLVGTCGCIFATSQHGSKQKHHSTDNKLILNKKIIFSRRRVWNGTHRR